MRFEPSAKPPVFDLDELSSKLAFARLRLRDALQIQPIRDALTGVHTRRFMNEMLTRQIHRATRKQRSFALIVLDFDYLQHFNCNYGHRAGDEVLRELGKLLISRAQPGETSYRVAGDEFVILLPDTSVEAASLSAQQLKEEFAGLRIPYNEENLQPPSFTTGVAGYPESGTTGESLFQVAEEAMYAVKSRARVPIML